MPMTDRNTTKACQTVGGNNPYPSNLTGCRSVLNPRFSETRGDLDCAASVPVWRHPSRQVALSAQGVEIANETVEVLRRYEGGQSAKVVNIDLHVGILEGDEMGLRRLVRLLKEIEGEEGRRNAFAQVNKGYHYGKSGL